MTKRWPIFVFAGLVVGGCKDNAAPPKSDTTTIACFVASQDRCKEHPLANEVQRKALEGECSSASGALSSPAACPPAGFIGKCTVPGAGGGGAEIRRWYKAADAAYQQDFCVNTAKGVWSTTF